jgi:hypothetical protein
MSGLRFPILVTIVILILLLFGVATCRPSSGAPAMAPIAQPAAYATRNLPPCQHVSEFDNRAPNVYTGF